MFSSFEIAACILRKKCYTDFSVMEMIFVCDNCHFLFSRTVEPEQCPDCGKYMVRPAVEAEQQEYEKRLKEPTEDW